MNTKPLRVACINAIVTEEGDLIVAGTTGTLLRWDWDTSGKRTEMVWVAWDHYMLFPTDEANFDEPHTNGGLEDKTRFDNLRYVP